MSYLPRTIQTYARLTCITALLFLSSHSFADGHTGSAMPQSLPSQITSGLPSLNMPTGNNPPRLGLGSGGETQLPGSDPIPDDSGPVTDLPGTPPIPGPDPIPDDGIPHGSYSSILEVDGSGLTLKERTKLSFYVFTELNRRVVFTP